MLVGSDRRSYALATLEFRESGEFRKIVGRYYPEVTETRRIDVSYPGCVGFMRAFIWQLSDNGVWFFTSSLSRSPHLLLWRVDTSYAFPFTSTTLWRLSRAFQLSCSYMVTKLHEAVWCGAVTHCTHRMRRAISQFAFLP